MICRSGTLDEAEVEVEVSEEFLGDEELRARAEARLRESIGCALAVRLQAPGKVPPSEGGKLQRVLDRRSGRETSHPGDYPGWLDSS